MPTPPGPGRVLRSRRTAQGGRGVDNVSAHAARTAPLAYSAIDLPEVSLELRVLRSCVVGSGILLRSPTTWSTSVCCARPVRDGWRSTARRPCSTTGACTGESGEGRGHTCGCPRGWGRSSLWSWSLPMWCGTPLPTATFPHGHVQSRRRIRSRGRRWRVASYQRKVVEMGCSSHLPEGPQRTGGDPAPGNVATTRLPGAGSGSTPHR